MVAQDIPTLAQRLKQLADQNIYLGTSSWKYPGWLGQVYDESRYQTRGKFSKKKFEQNCLIEYATIFPTVSGDFSFYQFPSDATWKRILDPLPDGYRFSLKIPEDITVERFPDLPRYGKRAGTSNGHFMDAGLLHEQLLEPLEPYTNKLGVLMFQFGTFHSGSMCDPDQFSVKMDDLLAGLPMDRFRFAVEVRNARFIEPQSPYLECLRQHRVAHCLSSWTRMPSIDEQVCRRDLFTAEYTTARFLLRPGRTYERAVQRFAPYNKIQDPYPQGREALKELVGYCQETGKTLYAYVNNRFEGNAIETIESVVASGGG